MIPAHCHRNAPPLAAASLVATLLCGCGAAFAADGESVLSNMLVRDSEVTLQMRSYYFNRTITNRSSSNPVPVPVYKQAWAIGGWLGYRSGWLADMLSFGLTGYTSQPLWAPANASGSLLLTSTQDGYSVLGQAYGSLKLFEQTLTGGRFLVNQPEVNPQDNRMTPNTFQGGNLGGTLAGVNYYGAYLTDEKTRNSTDFVNMATVAGAPTGVSSPMWLFGLSGEPVKDLKLRFSTYHVQNILNSTYGDASWLTPLTDATKLRLSGQLMYQSSTGYNLLSGGVPFSTHVGGVKADLLSGGATATFAYTQTSQSFNYRTPYGSWAGYTGMIIQDFNLAGQKAWQIGGTYDFAGAGLPGFVLNGSVTSAGSVVTIVNGTATATPKLTEYDLTMDYRFSAGDWPKWAKPMWIRARAAYLDQSALGHTTDYRIILNYPLDFK